MPNSSLGRAAAALVLLFGTGAAPLQGWAQSAPKTAAKPAAKPAKPARPAVADPQAGIRAAVNEGTVTILTDGVTERSGLVTELAGELAEAVDSDGQLRLLPVMGYGATTSVRDLLYLRGIDLGILNADVLTYLSLERKMPEAARRLRYVTRLLDKTVFIAARRDITTLSDLKGRSVAVSGKDSDAHVTARTVLGLAGVEANLVFAKADQAAAMLAAGEVSALVVLDRDALALERRLGKDADVHLLPLAAEGALAKVYESRLVTADEAPGLVPPEGARALTVPTVLAVFGWRPTHKRYAAVNSFVATLFGAMSRLQARDDGGVWQQIDPRSTVPGWQRYEPVVPLLAGLPPRRQPALAVPKAVLPDEPVAAATLTQGPQAPESPQSAEPAAEPPAAELAAAPAGAAVASLDPALGDVVVKAPDPGTPAPAGVAATAPAKPLPALKVLAAPVAGLVEEGTAARGLLADIVLQRLAAGRPAGSTVADTLEATGTAVVNLERLKASGEADAALVSAAPDCPADPAALAAADATGLCQDFLVSVPLFQVVNGFFSQPGGPGFDSDADAVGRSVCVAAGTDLAPLDAGGRNWVAEDRLTLIRQGSLEACFAQLADGKVEWVYADEFSGRAALSRLDPNSPIDLREQPVAVTAFRLAMPRSRTDAASLLARVNAALTSPAAAEAAAQLVADRLARTGSLSGN